MVGDGPTPDDAICGHFFGIKPSPTGSFSSSKVSTHNASVHDIQTAAQLGSADITIFGASLPQYGNAKDTRFKVEGADLQKLRNAQAEANYIIYSKTSSSLCTVDDEDFREMLRVRDPHGGFLTHHNLFDWIDAEFDIFRFFCELDMVLCVLYHRGNAFVQMGHDSGTPNSRRKFQAGGAQFVAPFKAEIVNALLERYLAKIPGDAQITIGSLLGSGADYDGNDFGSLFKGLVGPSGMGKTSLVQQLLDKSCDPESLAFEQKNIAFCFARCMDGKAAAVATLLKQRFFDVTGFTWSLVGRASIEDWAALAVAVALETEEEGCLMHSTDKIPSWAVGKLKKSKGKKPHDPFPGGVSLMKRVHDDAKHFSYGERRDALSKSTIASPNSPPLPPLTPHLRLLLLTHDRQDMRLRGLRGRHAEARPERHAHRGAEGARAQHDAS
jgi:hypothetical protein